MKVKDLYLVDQLTNVAPSPLSQHETFGFKIQIVNGETGSKTNFLNLSIEQFKKVEKILLAGNKP